MRGLLLDLGQSLFRVVLAREARRRVDRHGQCLAGALFVSSFQGRQAEMVLDDGLVRQFGRAVLEQVCGSLIYAALVEDPPQWIRDVRVVGIASLARWANSSALAPSRRVTHEPRRGIEDTPPRFRDLPSGLLEDWNLEDWNAHYAFLDTLRLHPAPRPTKAVPTIKRVVGSGTTPGPVTSTGPVWRLLSMSTSATKRLLRLFGTVN